ncbi:MAG: nucleotidyltransferase domain-containing protein [Deferribacteraceae bacterium]|jgi:predicted nucleotidyltransferase|nr:nucleotidyltransferase domain-containing protein [Deferribacteraceae bacterium]
MIDIFIETRHLKILTDIFDTYCPNAEVWAYGSRVNGGAHEGSDLDLAIHNPCIAVHKLREIICESNIPFLVDMLEFDKLSESFKEEIKRKYVVIYKAGVVLRHGS